MQEIQTCKKSCRTRKQDILWVYNKGSSPLADVYPAAMHIFLSGASLPFAWPAADDCHTPSDT